MKKMMFKKAVALLILIAFAISFAACSKERKFSLKDFDDHKDTITKQYAFFGDDSSEQLVYSAEKLLAFQNTVTSYQPVYGYDELFDYTQAIDRMKNNYTVSNHAFSALDADGNFTKEHLFEIVRKNNAQYLANLKTSVVKDVPDDVLIRVCEILTETTNDILTQYPEIDKDRVYCNFGNLKVVEKKSALDFAAVEAGMVLHINSNTSQMVGIMTSSNMYSVIIHETMHIIQYGCTCEQIEGCVRRCGLAYAYPDEEQDYSDWLWLAEGSAERMANLYTNVEPMTYTTYVNYLLSLDLATMLQEDVPANYVETIYFFNSLDRLFDLFGADTEEEKVEVYKMIYSLEIMQSEPVDVQETYQRTYGIEWTDDIRDTVNNKVKRPIVQTLTKSFYNNLASAIVNHTVTKNDALFLLNLYDSTINYHLRLDKTEYDEYNKQFKPWYSGIQSEFFACFENLSLDDYQAYTAHDGSSEINAGLKWLNAEKQNFLIYKFQDNLCQYKFLEEVSG